MKKLRHFLLLLLTLSIALMAFPSSQVRASGSTISIGSPGAVPEGGTFVVSVNIDTVTNLASGQFGIAYNPAVIRVIGAESGIEGVTAGLLNGTKIIPIDMWNFSPPGTQGGMRVVIRVPVMQPASGTGTLAQVHFQALPATAGQSSFLNLVDFPDAPSFFRGLWNNTLNLIEATWVSGSVSIVTANPAPVVTGVSPPSGPLGGGTGITISGTGFVTGATVTIGGTAATGVNFISPTSLTAITPAGTAGAKNVVVTNPDAQSGSLPNGFTYIPAPSVIGIAPNSGPTSGGTPVTITGTGFITGATVNIGGTAATGVSFVSPTSLTAITPAGTAGAKNVVVTNLDAQSGSLPNGFTYIPAPSVIGIAPNSGPTSGGTPVTITGTGFVTGATVNIGGTAATGVNFVSPTSLTAITPAGTAGAKDVVVTNLDAQSGSLPNGFTYIPAPSVIGIAPNSGPTSGGTPVTITGTGFATGATVNIGGTAATGVNFVSPTSLTAITPAGTAGAKDVVVTNLDAQSGSLPNGFTYVINSVEIAVVLQGGSRPDSGWVIPLTARFFTPGADVMTALPVYTFNLTTAKVGGNATAQCTGVTPGIYDITAVSEHTLLNVKRNVTIVSSVNTVNLGTLLEGNANNNDRINIQDFGLLSASYGKLSGDPAYNAMADFDRNGRVNIQDFGLLSANYLKLSPIEVP